MCGQCQAVRDGVQVSANFAVTIDYLNVKKRDTCSRFGLFKLDVWIKRITEVKEVSKFFFTVSPYKEDVIYVPEPHEWFVGGSFQKMIFQATHVEICIARCHFSPHCCPRLLNKVLALKGEIDITDITDIKQWGSRMRLKEYFADSDNTNTEPSDDTTYKKPSKWTPSPWQRPSLRLLHKWSGTCNPSTCFQ